MSFNSITDCLGVYGDGNSCFGEGAHSPDVLSTASVSAFLGQVHVCEDEVLGFNMNPLNGDPGNAALLQRSPSPHLSAIMRHDAPICGGSFSSTASFEDDISLQELQTAFSSLDWLDNLYDGDWCFPGDFLRSANDMNTITGDWAVPYNEMSLPQHVDARTRCDSGVQKAEGGNVWSLMSGREAKLASFQDAANFCGRHNGGRATSTMPVYEGRVAMRTPRKPPMPGRTLTSCRRTGGVRKPISRRTTLDCPSTATGGGRRSKGVTMLYRTLTRKLLAGSGWIMDSSISKEDSKTLLKILMGQELASILSIESVLEEIEETAPSKKEELCDVFLSDLMSCYVGVDIDVKQAVAYIQRLKGPYRLVQDFEKLLGDKPWPPNMPEEEELRRYGCYLEGECPRDSPMA